MFKWQGRAALASNTPLSQDLTAVFNGVAASLREFHVSASGAQDEQNGTQMLQRVAQVSRAQRSEQVGREIQNLSAQASPNLVFRPSFLSHASTANANASRPRPNLITRVITEKSGSNYVPGTEGRGLGLRGRGGGPLQSRGGGRGGGVGRRAARPRVAGRRAKIIPEKPLTDATGREVSFGALKTTLSGARKRPSELETFEPTLPEEIEAAQLVTAEVLDSLGSQALPKPVDRRDPQKLAERLLAGEVIRFEHENERDRIIGLARKISKGILSEKSGGDADSRHVRAKGHRSGLSARSWQQALRRKVVGGEYDKALLESLQQPPLPGLENLSRTLALNGTYKAGDITGMMKKIQELLPAQRPTGRAPQPQLR